MLQRLKDLAVPAILLFTCLILVGFEFKAEKAKGIVVFTREQKGLPVAEEHDDDEKPRKKRGPLILIPKRTLLKSKSDILFRTTDTAMMLPGIRKIVVKAEAVEPGPKGNVGPNQITSSVKPIRGIGYINNPLPFSGGVILEAEETGEREEPEKAKLKILREEISFNPQEPVAGEPAEVSVTVHNVGGTEVPVNGISIAIYKEIANNFQGWLTITQDEVIPPQDSKTFSAQWTSELAETFCVMAEMRLTEGYDAAEIVYNQVVSDPVQVTGVPALCFSDETIRIVGQRREGKEIKVMGRVLNHGTAESSSDTKVSFYVSEALMGEYTVGSVAPDPGDKCPAPFTFLWTPAAGSYALECVIMPDDIIVHKTVEIEKSRAANPLSILRMTEQDIVLTRVRLYPGNIMAKMFVRGMIQNIGEETVADGTYLVRLTVEDKDSSTAGRLEQLGQYQGSEIMPGGAAYFPAEAALYIPSPGGHDAVFRITSLISKEEDIVVKKSFDTPLVPSPAIIQSSAWQIPKPAIVGEDAEILFVLRNVGKYPSNAGQCQVKKPAGEALFTGTFSALEPRTAETISIPFDPSVLGQGTHILELELVFGEMHPPLKQLFIVSILPERDYPVHLDVSILEASIHELVEEQIEAIGLVDFTVLIENIGMGPSPVGRLVIRNLLTETQFLEEDLAAMEFGSSVEKDFSIKLSLLDKGRNYIEVAAIIDEDEEFPPKAVFYVDILEWGEAHGGEQGPREIADKLYRATELMDEAWTDMGRVYTEFTDMLSWTHNLDNFITTLEDYEKEAKQQFRASTVTVPAGCPFLQGLDTVVDMLNIEDLSERMTADIKVFERNGTFKGQWLQTEMTTLGPRLNGYAGVSGDSISEVILNQQDSVTFSKTFLKDLAEALDKKEDPAEIMKQLRKTYRDRYTRADSMIRAIEPFLSYLKFDSDDDVCPMKMTAYDTHLRLGALFYTEREVLEAARDNYFGGTFEDK